MNANEAVALPDSVKSVYAGDELDARKLLEAAEANPRRCPRPCGPGPVANWESSRVRSARHRPIP